LLQNHSITKKNARRHSRRRQLRTALSNCHVNIIVVPGAIFL
jgi:hypothetical protein